MLVFASVDYPGHRRTPRSVETSPDSRTGTLRAVSLVAAVALTGCTVPGLRECSPDQAVPAVFVDTALLALDEPQNVLVCLDDECSELGFGAGRDDSVTEVRVDGDQIQRTIVVRTLAGEVIAGPSRIEIPVVEEGCPGEALQGSFVVSENGEIEQVP